MKKVIVLIAIAGLLIPLFGAGHTLPEHHFAQGAWQMRADRIFQTDVGEPLAKVNIRAPQAETMVYEFNVRYEGGAEDLHAGFGIHVFADSVHPGESWGNGKSYLLWLNYDADPVTKDVPAGFSAQIYKSKSHSKMDLVQSVDLNHFTYLLKPEYYGAKIPVKLVINGDTGLVKAYSPLDPNYYFYFYIGDGTPMKGDWIALRTNSLSVSFGM